MRLWIILCSAFLASATIAEEPFPIASTSDFHVEEFEFPIQVWLPENYDSKRSWPTLFYYHGTNGKPTIETFRLLTGSKDWVLIGMGYKHRGPEQYSEENLADEIEIYHSVVKDLGKKTNINQDKIYFAGFSKGGWMTSMMLQRLPELAGGMILGGGFFKVPNATLDPLDHVYIGVGEIDANVARSYQARKIFKEAGNTHTSIEFWDGMAHSMPNAFHDKPSQKIRQWLQVQADLVSQAKAIEWFDQEFREIRKLEKTDLPAALHQLIHISTLPYSKLLDAEARKALLSKQEDYKNNEALKNEMSAWIAFQKALDLESRDKYLSTYAEALGKYNEVAKSFPGTKYGKRAANSSKRITTTLGLQ